MTDAATAEKPSRATRRRKDREAKSPTVDFATARKKVGLDDFLIAKGVEAFMALPRKPIDLSRELWGLNEEYAYLFNPEGKIFRFDDGVVMFLKDFQTEVADRRIKRINADGAEVEISASKEWLEWPQKTKIKRLIYTPRRIDDPVDLSDGSFNLWPGWATEEPMKGDVSLFLQLLDRICEGEPQTVEYLLQWLAYPVQFPGAKLYTALVLRGLSGSGKSLLGYTMRRCVYGYANVSVIGQSQLVSQFNQWLARKQLILAEEVAAIDKRAGQDMLKALITQETVTVNMKHKPEYTLTDHANYIFTSNHPDPLSLDEDDRRFFVLKVINKFPPEFRDRYDAWYQKPPAAQAILWHLLNEVDVSAFNPRAEAPMTKAKQETINLSKTELHNWIEDRVIGAYDRAFAIGETPTLCDLQTAETIAKAYEAAHPGRHAHSPSVGKILSRLAALPKFRDKIAKLPEISAREGNLRPYAFRNLEKWKTATPDEMRAHWDAEVIREDRTRAKLGGAVSLDDARKAREAKK